MKDFYFPLAGFLMGVVLPTSVLAVEIDVSRFDQNNNKRIDLGAEATALIKHVNNKFYREIDKNRDGSISAAEGKEYDGELAKHFSSDIGDFKKNMELKGGMSFPKGHLAK